MSRGASTRTSVHFGKVVAEQLSPPLGAAQPCQGADRTLLVALITEALTSLELDPATARHCLESARQLVTSRGRGEHLKKCLLADWQVRRAKEFIHDNLGTSLRIEQVAKRVHLSASYFSRSFKSTIGVSYSDFVAMTRVDLAKKLLLTTDMSISKIALACGLADQSHLTRVFRRVVGCPPNTWRRQLRRCQIMEGPSIAGG